MSRSKDDRETSTTSADHSFMRMRVCICFCKMWFAWRGGDEEDILKVFHLDSRIMGCKVGYLPKHLAAQADRYDSLCARIVEIYSSDRTLCTSVTKCQKYHRGVGCCMTTIEEMRDMFVIA